MNVHFTPREFQVIEGICQGLDSRQIGQKLGISSDTVKCHTYSIYNKAGMGTRIEFAMWAVYHGMYDPWHGKPRPERKTDHAQSA